MLNQNDEVLTGTDNNAGSDKLKPCPFCGDDNATIQKDELGDFYVWCYKCESRSAGVGTKQHAKSSWNKRKGCNNG